jgi:hypothetical protein
LAITPPALSQLWQSVFTTSWRNVQNESYTLSFSAPPVVTGGQRPANASRLGSPHRCPARHGNRRLNICSGNIHRERCDKRLGEWAFIARWPLSDVLPYSAAIFTSRRLVVSEGYQVDGKWITSIPKGAALAVDDKGRVAYEAEYADDLNNISEGTRHRGVFIDGHFALSLADGAEHAGFILTKEGFIVPQGYLRSFHSRTDAFPQFRKNVHGQFLIPVNLSPQGFLLLLASPAAH